MGLTIHWSFKSRGSRDRIHTQLAELRSACLDLPLESVGELVWLHRAEIQKILDDREHPLRWAMIQAEDSVTVEKTERSERSMRVLPEELMMFSTWPGEGCEEANFFLGRFPAEVIYEGRAIPTGLAAWCGRSFCKTQYASTVSLAHFLRCHLAVSAALEKAKALKFLKEVHDEGDYWTKRDVRALAQEVGEWNEMIAGFVGAMDAAGLTGVSPITEHPQFELLEHEGLRKPSIAECAKKMAEVAQKLLPPRPAA